MTSREDDVPGSEETFTFDDTNSHQSDSFNEIVSCPFRTLSSVDCPWTGTLSDTGDHVRRAHGSETSDLPVKFIVTLQNIPTAQHYRKAVYIWGRLFYLNWILKNGTFLFSVFHFEPQNEPSGFTYNFRISGHKRKVSITDACRSYLQEQSEVSRLGGYLALNYSTVEKYIDQSKGLSCRIYIRGMHATGSSAYDMTEEYMSVPSQVCRPSIISSPHLILSASSNHSPHSSIKLSSVIYFLSFHLLCGFFVMFSFSFLFKQLATCCI
jgi:Seven in absentia protein family.